MGLKIFLTLLISQPVWAAVSGGESTQHFNIRTSPVSLVTALIQNVRTDYDLDLSGEIGLSRRLALGPKANLIRKHEDDLDLTSVGMGLEANYYLSQSRWKNSFVLAPSMGVLFHDPNIKNPGANVLTEGSDLSYYGTALFGYHWFWSNGVNLRTAAGLEYNSEHSFLVARTLNAFESDTKAYRARKTPLSFRWAVNVGWIF